MHVLRDFLLELVLLWAVAAFAWALIHVAAALAACWGAGPWRAKFGRRRAAIAARVWGALGTFL